LDLYRREVAVSVSPRVHLSVIDVHPEHPRRTLVFIHGFGGQARQWKHQVEAFGLHHRVIAPDLRGHGLSDKPRSVYDVEELLSDLEALLLQLEAKPPLALIGHSFGGAIATEYALRHPEQVDRLILISTPGEYRLHPIYRFLFHLPLPLLRAAEPFVRPWLHAPAHVLQALYMHAMSRWVGWPRFRSLTQPTLVIRGHRDMVFERPLFEEVARAIPRGEDLNVGASRHMVMIERYEAVNRAIGRFLEDRPTRSWREPSPATISPRSALWHQRPWLAFYDEGVPPTVAIPHIPLHELLRSAARRFPNHHAICFGNARYTYRELNREVNRFAHALRSLGLNIGERVAILLPNLPQFIIAFYGTLKAGGVAVLLPPGEDEEELKRQIADAEVRILITLTTQADAMRRLQRELGIPHLLLTAPGDYLLRSSDSRDGKPSHLSASEGSTCGVNGWRLTRITNRTSRWIPDPRRSSCILEGLQRRPKG